MRPIFLPDTAMSDDQAVVEAFYRYIYHCHQGGGIFGSILGTGTGTDGDVYTALYYSGEIRNGGHQQYILNSDDNPIIHQAALAGLALIDAGPQHAILKDMRAWVLENPQFVEMIFRHELPSQYRPGRPPVLDALDARFFDAQDRHSVETCAAAWIRAYPDLRIVSEAEFMALLEGKEASVASPVSRPGGARIRLLDRVMTTIFGR
ncbi:DMP19 family protein [Brevundimonas sp.]